jgi:polyisoprenoid-binding protein YceI
VPNYTRGTLYVFTFKEGLLSKVAHDLRLSVQRFSVQVDGENVVAAIATSALTVDGAMKKGNLSPGTLSDKDKRDIAGNIEKDVLKTSRNPEIRFEGTVSGDPEAAQFNVSGQLSLAGKTRALTIPIRREGKRLRGRVSFLQSDWGIKPFRALMGTLKVQDRVEVEVDLLDEPS